MRDKRGFSLIELLVVIAIIAILAAILFPIFIKARESGKKAVCTSNLKQVYSALSMYADDNDGRLTLSPAPVVSDWSEQYQGLALLYKYTRKDTVFTCPLSRMYGTTAAEKEKRNRDPEPMYKLYTGVYPDKGYTLRGSYHYWPQIYQEYRTEAEIATQGPPPPAKLDVNIYGTSTMEKRLVFHEYYPKAAPMIIKLRGPIVDSFLHRLGDGGNGVLCLTLKGDVKFLPANGYPFY